MHEHRRKLLAGLIALPLAAPAFADRVSRHNRVPLPADVPLTLEARTATLEAHYRFQPTPSVNLHEQGSGRLLFSTAVPPLHYLWLPEDGRCLVALTDPGSPWDAERVLVFAPDGRKLLEQPTEGRAGPDTAALLLPRIALADGPDGATLTVENRRGEVRAFDLPMLRN